MRAFVGFCSYYRRFVPQFAQVAAPLYQLTEGNKAFQWNDHCQEALTKLKTALITAPVLAYPSAEDQFVLDTHASDDGIGAVLSQVQGGDEKVLAYYSKTLSKSERRYCVTRKELLAVVTSIRHFIITCMASASSCEAITVHYNGCLVSKNQRVRWPAGWKY